MRRKKEPIHRNVWVASGTSFLTDISSEMILNVLPLFLANVLGVRVWAVGAVEGLADTTASIVKLYSGWLSDRTRTRKWLAVLGYSISALAKPFYLVASAWTVVAGIRWGDRVGKGVRTAPRDALLADSTTSSRHGFVFGLHRSADTAGAFVACSVIFEMGNSADAFLVLRAQERGMSVIQVLWVLLAFNVVYALVATPAGALFDRIPRKWVICASWGIYSVSYLGFAMAGSSRHVVGFYLLYGVYRGMVAGAAKALVAELVPIDMRGIAYGGYAAAIGLVSLPASLLAGVLWEGIGSWSRLIA